eukprot:TRINITY_DN68415_c0_g1_i1.p1 TRINITY_DN68415_c0_g1~~TRINITY_DN68415_c0_g1_i1.p1  ORF type:complete len:300 (+),score=6.55 TRINITY_DN68415_c0_g1_i1:51-950(+)
MAEIKQVKQEPQLTATRTLSSVILGGIAGGTAKSITYPLERVKTIGQTHATRFGLAQAWTLGIDVLKKDGILAFWKGNGVSVARTVPYIGIAYGTFDFFQKQVNLLISDAVISRFCAGSLSGVLAAVCTYPLDVVRSRMAASRVVKGYAETATAGEGYKWLFRGIGPTLVGVVPYAGLSFCIFHTSKAQLQQRTKTTKLSPVQNMLCGALAGAVSQTVTYPIDTLRKRMQTDMLLVAKGERDGASYRGGTWWQTARGMVQQEGWYSFWRGAQLNFMKGITAAGLSFAINEALKDSFLRQ